MSTDDSFQWPLAAGLTGFSWICICPVGESFNFRLRKNLGPSGYPKNGGKSPSCFLRIPGLTTSWKKTLGVFGDKKVPSEIMSHRCLERTEQTTNDGMFGKCQYEFCSGQRFWTKQRPLPFNYPNCIKLLSISKSRFLRILWVHSLDSSALDPKSDHKTTVCLTVRCRLLGHTDFSLR